LSYFPSLPPDLYFALNNLTDEERQKLELFEYELKHSKLNDIALSISIQFEKKLLKEFHNRRIINCYYSLLAIAGKYDKILEKSKELESIEDLFWNLLVNHLENQGTYSLPKINREKYNFSEVEKLVFAAIESTLDIGIWPLDRLDYIKKIQEEHSTYIFHHLMLFSVLLRASMIIIANFTKETIEFLSPWYNFVNAYGVKFAKMIILHLYGTVTTYLGKFEEAGKYFNESYELATSLNFKYKDYTLNNLGLIAIRLRRYNDAKEIFDELIKRNPDLLSYNLNKLIILNEMNNVDEAILFLEDFKNRFKDKIKISVIQRIASEIYLKTGNEQKIRETLSEAEEIEKKYSIQPNIVTLYRIKADLKILKGDYIKAIEYYEEELKLTEPVGNLDEIFQAYTKIIACRIDQLVSNPNDIDNKNKLYSMINSIISLADEQEMPQSSIQGLMLRAQVFIEEKLFNEGREDLKVALKIAKQFNYEELKELVEKEIQELNRLEDKQDILEIEKSSFRDRMKSKLKLLIGSQSGGKMKKIEYTLHGLMVVNASGLNIYDYTFSKDMSSDPTLIAGLITAMSAFIEEIIKGKGFLKSINHDDLTLMMEPLKGYVVVCITSKETFELRRKVQLLSSELEKVIKNKQVELESGILTESFRNQIDRTVESNFN
jgi:tetratricopeptide (TPR) repeat protein